MGWLTWLYGALIMTHSLTLQHGTLVPNILTLISNLLVIYAEEEQDFTIYVCVSFLGVFYGNSKVHVQSYL